MPNLFSWYGKISRGIKNRQVFSSGNKIFNFEREMNGFCTLVEKNAPVEERRFNGN